MAMMQCPECQQSISEKAYACPLCGHPINDFPQPKPIKYQLTRYNPTSCAGATFVRVMGVLDIIGGVLCSILFSIQERVVGRYYTSTETYFNWGTFFTVLACCVVSSIFFFILANVIERVQHTYEIVSTLNIITSESTFFETAAPVPAASTPAAPVAAPASVPPAPADDQWSCPFCSEKNPKSKIYCSVCGKEQPGIREAAAADKASSAAQDAEWRCENCWRMNPAEEKKCSHCGNNKT